MSKLNEDRSYFKPFNYPWAYEHWLRHEQSHWLHTEVPLLEDIKDWRGKLTESERYFLTNVFRFFTQADIDVAGGYVNYYLPTFPQPEVRMMLSSFAAREALHIAAYSHLIESMGMPESIYNEFLQFQAMKEKHDILAELKNTPKEEIANKIALISVFTEGMQLFSSFIMLLNFPRHGLMKGMGQIVTWSIIDETMHVEAMVKLFRTYIEENKSLWKDDLKSKIYTMATKLVELEDNFIELSFKMGPMKDLTEEDVKKYIRYIADRRLISLGLKGIFKVKKNPLPWVEEMINAPIHGNFFENRVTDYAKGALTGDWSDIWAN